MTGTILQIQQNRFTVINRIRDAKESPKVDNGYLYDVYLTAAGAVLKLFLEEYIMMGRSLLNKILMGR